MDFILFFGLKSNTIIYFLAQIILALITVGSRRLDLMGVFFSSFTEIELTYNIVSVLRVQHNDLICIYQTIIK